jgi:uncharacterized protein (DUF2384 family)
MAELNMTEKPNRSDPDLQVFATEVFGRDEPARKWLQTPHPMLDGLPPSTFASNEVRAQKVRGMLASLKHGGVA